jgi:hypothetical protein
MQSLLSPTPRTPTASVQFTMDAIPSLCAPLHPGFYMTADGGLLLDPGLRNKLLAPGRAMAAGTVPLV